MTTTKSESVIRWGLRIHILCYVVANVIQVLVWAMFDSGNHFWPIWSIVAWGIGLGFHIWAVSSSRLHHRY